MLKLENTRDGNQTLVYNDKYLLSKYQPLRDVERLIPEQTSGKAFILFSDILGYLHPLLEKSGVHSEHIFIYEIADMQALGFDGRKTTELGSFLEEILLQGLRPEILALSSMTKAWPQEFQRFQSAFQQALQTSLENLKVSSYFSRVWFSNYCRNIRPSSRLQILSEKKQAADFPIVVCAAGPSLEEHSQTLLQYQDKFFLISVLSAYNSLKAMGIIPDAVLINDAGVGNKLHGADLDPDIPVLSHIYASSAFLSGINNPVIFYNKPEEIIHPVFQLDQPSVSIDAGLVARQISQGPLIFCGLDLSYPRQRSDHSLAYAFSQRFFFKQTRIQPVQNGMTSFLRRKDLINHDNHWTQPHFQIIHNIVESTFPNAHYLAGGIDYQNLIKEKDLSLLSTSPIIPKSEILNSLVQTLNHYPKMDTLLEHINKKDDHNRIFIRQRIQKENLELSRQYYKNKIKKLYAEK